MIIDCEFKSVTRPGRWNGMLKNSSSSNLCEFSHVMSLWLLLFLYSYMHKTHAIWCCLLLLTDADSSVACLCLGFHDQIWQKKKSCIKNSLLFRPSCSGQTIDSLFIPMTILAENLGVNSKCICSSP